MSDAGLLPLAEITARASRALGKVDLHGRRGVTMLSVDETEAMALLLATLGLVPTVPGQQPPSAYFLTPSKET
jgi:hypothetical protein